MKIATKIEELHKMEELADRICREQLGQEPTKDNESFRKVIVHGMRYWQASSIPAEEKLKQKEQEAIEFGIFLIENLNTENVATDDSEIYAKKYFQRFLSHKAKQA